MLLVRGLQWGLGGSVRLRQRRRLQYERAAPPAVQLCQYDSHGVREVHGGLQTAGGDGAGVAEGTPRE